jgi:DNA-binding MarR family transcriptional regulator
MADGLEKAAAAAQPAADPFMVGLALKRSQHELRLAINAELAPLKTNISQVNVLREIKANPGVSSAQLARLAFLTPQSLGQLVAQMQERGLVERRPGGGRTLRHYITPAGERLCDEGIAKARAIDAAAFHGFSDEQLESLLETFHIIEERAAIARMRSKRLVVVDSH